MSQQRDRLHTQELYLPLDDSIMAEQVQCQEKLYDYNQTRPSEFEKRTAMLKDMFAESHRLEDEIKKQLGRVKYE